MCQDGGEKQSSLWVQTRVKPTLWERSIGKVQTWVASESAAQYTVMALMDSTLVYGANREGFSLGKLLSSASSVRVVPTTCVVAVCFDTWAACFLVLQVSLQELQPLHAYTNFKSAARDA